MLPGATRYASYGSATADGIRALRACGVPEKDRACKLPGVGWSIRFGLTVTLAAMRMIAR